MERWRDGWMEGRRAKSKSSEGNLTYCWEQEFNSPPFVSFALQMCNQESFCRVGDDVVSSLIEMDRQQSLIPAADGVHTVQHAPRCPVVWVSQDMSLIRLMGRHISKSLTEPTCCNPVMQRCILQSHLITQVSCILAS